MSVGQVSHANELFAAMAEISWQSLPETARANATLCLIDNVGCGIFGSQFGWTAAVRRFVAAEQMAGPCTILGSSQTASPARAALANGVAIHGYELDDVILGALLHPGTVVVPAALAVAESKKASPDRLLLGMVAGYEVSARIGKIFASCPDVGFHLTGVAGAVAASVAASVVAGFDTEALINAVGIACSRASGLKTFAQGSGGMVKRLHGGSAAETGVMACLLTELEFSGPAHAVDGRFGLLEAYGSHAADSSLLVTGLGTDWAIERAWTKVYPCCGVIHTGVEAVETLRKQHQIRADDVATIRFGLSKRGVEQNGLRQPKDTMGAQYSLPFSAALALTGDPRDPLAYAESNLNNRAILDAMQKIELHVDPEVDRAYPGLLGARTEIVLKDDSRIECTLWHAQGMPQNRCNPEEIKSKFRRLCGSHWGINAVNNTLSVLEDFAEGGSLPELSAALRLQSGEAAAGFSP